MADRVLSLRELNLAVLARQLLLDRARLPISSAIEQLAGLQAQAPDSPYTGLWTRLADFRREDLMCLLEQREVVRATLMRATLHLVTAKDYLLLRPALQPALTRSFRGFFGEQAKRLDLDRLVEAARAYVAQEPRTFPELRDFLSEVVPDADPQALAYAVRTHLPLVQVPPAGTWGYSGSPAHATAEAWLDGPLASPAEGLRHLVLRYLRAFGPATVKDIQAWSGLSRLKDTVEELRPGLRSFRDEGDRELLDVPDGLLPGADAPAPVRFLPEFDNLVLSHADRTRVLPEEYRRRVIRPPGRILATFLVDGFVRGTWRVESARDAVTLVIEPFDRLPVEAHDALQEEGHRLLRFIADGAGTFSVRLGEAD